MKAQLSQDHRHWLESFVADHGRAPRVLHIGNIANNAYNNAKVLNALGVESDVVCYDYYHIMGCPEWEDADCDVSGIDHMRPRWYEVDLRGFQRPRWFAQGPLLDCIAYLRAFRDGDTAQADALWDKLCVASGVLPPPADAPLAPPSAAEPAVMPEARSANPGVAARAGGAVARKARRVLGITRSVVTSHPMLTARRTVRFLRRTLGLPPAEIALAPVQGPAVAALAAAETVRERPHAELFDRLIACFRGHFPLRTDVLGDDDLAPYAACNTEWSALFTHYDVVIGYSTDSVFALLADKRPYVAFEHGTIRDIPFEDNAQGRIAALAYAEADVVFMTNADSLPQARKLHARKLVKGLHGFDWANMQRRLAAVQPADVAQLLGCGPGVTVFLAPARQHWREGFDTWLKGNDRIVHAVAKLAPLYRGRLKVVFVEWGAEVALTKELITSLGVEDLFAWIEPVPKADLWSLYRSVDAVIDQFVLPCIGSVTLEAIALGRPVITALDDQVMEEFYGQTIPLLNSHTADQIAMAMTEVIERTPRALAAGQRSRDWFMTYHTGQVLTDRLFDALRSALPSDIHAEIQL
jgi:glycosyltransferase involved in cell wall biosynthesis